MNKKDLTEADIRTKFITPAIEAAGWDKVTQMREEYFFTAGRIIVHFSDHPVETERVRKTSLGPQP